MWETNTIKIEIESDNNPPPPVVNGVTKKPG